MTDINVQNLYNQQTGSIQTAGASAVSTSAPIELVDQKVVEGEGNIDVAQTNNTSNTQTAQKRTVDELYNSIAALCTQYGISLSEAKKFGLMEKIAGVPQEELLNMPNSEIQKHVECLKAALEKLSANGKVDLKELATLANNYNIAIHTGWSIKGYQKAQNENQESISDRLERFFGIEDIYSCSKEKIKEYLKRYFDNYFTEKIDKGMSREEAVKLQLQDFAKLLINTPEEKRQIFIDAAKALLAENRPEGFESVFRSYTDDVKRTEAADSVTNKDMEELTTSPDVEGNVPTTDCATALYETRAKYQSEEGIKKSHTELNESAKKFFEENAEALKVIENKIANGEELTKEEQQLLVKKNNLYIAGAAGEMTGTANNVGISDEFKTQILNTMNSDAYELPIYREVIEQVVSYVEKHPETMTMTSEEFVKLMDKVTNGNYSTVVNDIKNGTTTALNEPAPAAVSTPAETASNNESSNTNNNNSFGFNNSPSVDTTRLQQLTSQIASQDTAVEPVEGVNGNTAASVSNNIASAAKAGISGFKAYIENNGPKKAVVEVFNNLQYIANQGIVKHAFRIYEGFADSLQADTLKRVNNSGLSALIKHTSDSTLMNMKGETFSNFYATQQIEDAAEKIEEKRA